MPLSPFGSVFHELSALLMIAAVLGALAIVLRQPLIVAFIVVGILVGPGALGWVRSADEIALLAEIGIAILLFVVGLRLDLALVRSIGPVSLMTGMGQVIFTSVIGYLIAIMLGLAPVPALYVAVALTFSSTIIIVKLLSDKREVDSLHGQIALGFLIVQDIVAIVALIVLTAFGAPDATGGLWTELGQVALKGLGMVVALALLMRFVLPRVLHLLARSHELLVLFAIAWAVTLATVSDALGFSKEVGAFLAGLTLASTPYREAIGSRLVGLRDFLLLFFFISLGAGLDLRLLGAQVGPAILFSVFVLVGNPLIVMAIMGYLGYRKRTGFLAGLTVAQISEFSLILGALGVSLGHLDAATMGLITLVGLITIGLSTYMILYSHPIYDRLAPWLGVFERRVPHRELNEPAPAARVDIVQFGLGRYGKNLADALERRGFSVLGVDFDPQAVRRWQAQGRPALYGDAEDFEFPAALPLAESRWVVSALPGREANLVLIDALKHHHFQGRVAVTAHTDEDARVFAARGADLVLRPFNDAAQDASAMIAEWARETPRPGGDAAN